MMTGADELRSRLEILLGAKPEAYVDKIEEARHLGELVANSNGTAPANDPTVKLVRAKLDERVDTDEQGRPRLTFSLPNQQSLDNLAQTLARLLITKQEG